MKSTLTGYVAPSIGHLSRLTTSLQNPLLIHNLRTWYLPVSDATPVGIDVITTSVGKFQAIPTNANNTLSYGYQSITVNSSLTVLNFSTLPRCIELDLNINTLLQLVNLQRYCKYIIKINFNDYTIENLATVLNLPNNINWSYFLTNYEFLILEIEYINKTLVNVLFAQLKSPSLTNYAEHTTDVIFNTRLWSNAADMSINAYTATITGVPIYRNGIELQNSRLAYTVDNAFILNEVNFSIEAFIKFLTPLDTGTIIGRWSDSSKQFWIRVNNAGVLEVSFNEGVGIVTLSYDLVAHLAQTMDYIHILVTRTFDVYKLFLNGVLVDSKKSTPFMTTSNARLTIGKLENAPSTGMVGNTSFNGIIREIKIAKSIKNNYSYAYIYPANPYKSDVAFLIQNSLVDRKTGQSPSFLSTVDTEPLLGVSNRRSFGLGSYSTAMLTKKHHVDYSPNPAYDIGGDVTIEGWIKNHTGNTRGTIIYYGNSTNFNFHVGIYDAALRFDAKDAALTLTSTISIADNIWTHFAYVREGTDNRLYLNGLFAGSISSSESLNFYNGCTLSLKRKEGQNGLEATLNTSLYPSKSHIEIEGICITKRALYNGSNASYANFILPGEFSYR